MTSHEEWYAGSPGSQTVSNSNYHAKCAGCVEREKQIAELSAKIADLETQRKEREASYRKWGVLPCPTCQDANARIADLEAITRHAHGSYDTLVDFARTDLSVCLAYIADLEAQLEKRAKVRVSCHDVWIRERERREKAEHERDEALKHGLALALQVDELEHSLELAEQGHANAH